MSCARLGDQEVLATAVDCMMYWRKTDMREILLLIVPASLLVVSVCQSRYIPISGVVKMNVFERITFKKKRVLIMPK